jgi:hypothetical protein
VPEVTVLITITITISLFPTGNIFQNMAAVMQHISAPVSHIKMSRKACPLIFTKTRGLLDLLFEELSFCMVLFINSLYTMDISVHRVTTGIWSLVGVLPNLKRSLQVFWSLTDLMKQLRCLTSDLSSSSSGLSSMVATLPWLVKGLIQV